MQDWLTWSYWVDGVLDSLHFICALGALLLGPIVLMRRKGDHTHRKANHPPLFRSCNRVHRV